MPALSAPASARAINRRALKILMRPSNSSIVRSSAARAAAGSASPRSASSAWLRRRVNGVRRSWAMLSETSRMPAIRSPMRASISLRPRARRSSSSSEPRDGQSPRQIARHDGARRNVHRVDAPQHPAGDEQRAERGQRGKEDQRNRHGANHHRADSGAIARDHARRAGESRPAAGRCAPRRDGRARIRRVVS